MHADSTAISAVGSIFCVFVSVAAEGAASDGQLGIRSLAFDGDRRTAGRAGGTFAVEDDRIIFKIGTRDAQALVATQIGSHRADDRIILADLKGISLEGNTVNGHVLVVSHGYVSHAGRSIFASRHAAVEGGTISLDGYQGFGRICAALLKSHIADGSARIKINDAIVAGLAIEFAARQRHCSFVIEETSPCNLVDNDFYALINVDISVIKGQIVKGGILLVPCRGDDGRRPGSAILESQCHSGNGKLGILWLGIPGDHCVTIPV